jgi:tetratricopeptide (TPR) repeat protein
MQLNKFTRILIIVCSAFAAQAQKDAQTIYEGNQLYFSGRYPESSAEYARALEANPNNRKANFNLGAALYKNAMLIKSGKLSVPNGQNIPADSLANMVFDKSAEQFAVVANGVSDKDTLHRAWHNIGNCYLQKKDYQQAITAYKKALKYNPKDEETRYNLAYALKHMPPEKKGGGGGQKPQPQNQDQKQKQQQQSQMSKEQADKLLKAMMEAEKKLQDKRKHKQDDPSQRDVEKDW